MPELDRRITVRIFESGTRDRNDEFIPGTATDFPIWARLEERQLEAVIGDGATRGAFERNWIIRWLPALVGRNTSTVKVVVDDQTFNVSDVEEVIRMGQRRRFLRIKIARDG